MLVFFPVLTFGMAYALFSRRRRLNRGESFLAAMVLCGLLTVFFTEILSAGQNLHTSGVVLAWGLSLLLLSPAVFYLTTPLKTDLFLLRSLPAPAKIMLLLTAALGCALFLQALLVSPNSWDSTTYHLSRVEHWAQDRTVAYYPTHIVRQDNYMPYAEWCLLQLRLLTGPQAPYGLLQFSCMLTTLCAVWLIAGLLGAQTVGRSLAVLLAAALPMGVLQSTSTQTDYVVTQWFAIFVYFLLKSRQGGDSLAIVLAAVALGLAWLTKGYSYLYGLPFLVWWLMSAQGRWPQRLLILLGMLSIAALINAGYYWRNDNAFGRLLWSREHLSNVSLSPSIFAANVLRNCALHLISPWASWNTWVGDHLHTLARHLGIDLDPVKGTFGFHAFELQPMMFDEDYAGNFLHCGLFTLAGLTAAWQWARGKRGMAGGFVLAVLVMFVLLCLCLRFQPFGSRFHLAIFVLLCAWAALVMEKHWPRPLVLGAALAAWLGCLPWVVFNANKPLLGPDPIWRLGPLQQAFLTDPLWQGHMEALGRQIERSACRDIGFYGVEDSKEYLLWRVLLGKNLGNFRLENVAVSNVTAQRPYPLGPFKPCLVVSLYFKTPPALDLSDGIYLRSSVFESGPPQNRHHSGLYVPLEFWAGPTQK